eukprot:jgi/Orpsp1_1/1188946/evm.model.d7180000068427.1
MDDNNTINPESTEELLTFAAEIGSSLLIQNRELEEINKRLSLKVENLTNDQLAISNQYQELESINQSLRLRIQYLEEENEHIHSKLKFQIKGENDLKDNLYLQNEKEIYQLNSELEQKNNDIKRAKDKINELADICKKQKDDILKLQEEQEESIKQHLTLEKLKDEKREYKNSIEDLESNVTKLDTENTDLKESLDKINKVLIEKNKIIKKYNSINTGILKELEKIILNSMYIKKENIISEKKDKKEECLLFGIHIDNLTLDIKGDIIEMIKCFFDINKLKLEAILYEDINNQEQFEDNLNNETPHSIKTHKYNSTSISGNDETIYNQSIDSGSIYDTSISSDEIILDPNFEINSIYSGISDISNYEKEKNSDLDVSTNEEFFNNLISENKSNDKNKKLNNEEDKLEEKEYLSKIYQEVLKCVDQCNNKKMKRISIPVIEKLKLNIRNTYLNLINITVKQINDNHEKERKNSDDNIYDDDKAASLSWLIYPLSLQYYKLLIYIYDIESSMIKKINLDQYNKNIKEIKQLKDNKNI